MTAAISLRFRDEDIKGLDVVFLLYPEARVPFDTLLRWRIIGGRILFVSLLSPALLA